MEFLDEEIGKFGRGDGIPVRNHFSNRFIGGMADTCEHREWAESNRPAKFNAVVARQPDIPTPAPDDGHNIKVMVYLSNAV